MSRIARVVSAGLVGFVLSTAARAVVITNIVTDDFESYADQAAFQAAWPAIGTDVTNPSGLLSTAQSVSPTHGIQVPGTASNNQYRNRRTFAETSTLSSSGNMGIGDQLIWSFDFYDSNASASPSRNFSNMQDSTAPGSTNQLIAMGENNNQSSTASGGNFYMARILGFSATTVDPDGGANEDVVGSGAFFKLNDYGVGLRSTGWHNLKAILSTDDGNSTDFAFYVDNVLAETVNNVGTAASIRSFDPITLGAGLSNASVEVDFHNVALQYSSIPEPASLGLLMLAGLSVRRNQRARQ